MSPYPLTPSLVSWAFTYPDDPVATKIIASLPPDMVPTLKQAVETENTNHAMIAKLLSQMLGIPQPTRTNIMK